MTDTPQQLPIEIRDWRDRSVIYSTTSARTLREAVDEAVRATRSLAYASLDGARLVGASLAGARLDGARLVGASLAYASLDGARLVGARLDGASLAYASLDGARLAGASLAYASLAGASLDGASLDGASLVDASLDGARLAGASLDGASLDGARLAGASLDGASLDGARLVGASLDGARLVGARLDGARLDGDGKIIVAKGSEAAYAGPVGDNQRMVFGFVARADGAHPTPWIVLRCGCFLGDESAYRERIEKYRENPAYLAQCLAALAACKDIAGTWGVLPALDEHMKGDGQ